MSNIQQLILIYASHTVQEVKNQPELIEGKVGKTLQELAKTDFPKDQELVESLKRGIEGHAELNTADKKAQIGKCLRLLYSMVFGRGEASTIVLRMDTAAQLLTQMYAGGWSADQHRHFDFAFQLLKEWNNYFLSYTNDGGKIVNAKYKAVVDLFTEPAVLTKRNKESDNVLADAIVYSLKIRSLSRRSFYDKESIKVGDNLQDKILPAASKTFAFVQLVHLETFDTTGEVNWPFTEYQIFNAHNESEMSSQQAYRDVFKGRFAAILAGEKADLQLAVVPFEYEVWFNRIFSDTHFLTLPTDTASFERTMQELSAAIVNITYGIIDNIPA